MRDLIWDDLLERIAAMIDRAPGNQDVEELEAWSEIRRRIAALVETVRRGLPSLRLEDAEDLVQLTLVRLQERTVLEAVRSARAPQAYLLVIIRNMARDQLRRVSRETVLTDQWPAPARSGLPLDVRRIIESLDPQDQLLLHGVFIEGKTFAEIAAEIGLPYSTVAKRVFRLVAQVRRMYQEKTGGELN